MKQSKLKKHDAFAKLEKEHNAKKAKPFEEKWQDTFYLDAYEMARDGLSTRKIAKHFKVHITTFKTMWYERKPLLKTSIIRGRDARKKAMEKSFKAHSEELLSEENKALWNQITTAYYEQTPLDAIKELVLGKSDAVRQRMWIQAVIHFDFDQKLASQVVGVSKAVLDRWIAEDTEFNDLLSEIAWQKQNFVEAKLMELVKTGDSKATVFANQTLNAERGYGKVSKHIIEGTITHKHIISLKKLDLDTDVLLKLENAIREVELAGGSVLALDDKKEKKPQHHLSDHSRRILEAEVIG